MEGLTLTMMSALATATSTATAMATGEGVISWVMTAINIAILISNAALSIYRTWRDRDKDKESTEKKDDNGPQDKSNG